MDATLGRFGDRRLEKGGPFFCRVCRGLGRFGFAALAGTVPGRCGLRVFCAIRP